MNEWSRYIALRLGWSPDRKILTIILDNPGKRNAVSAEMDAELQRVFTDASIDPDIYAIILTGVDGAFCSGADLDALPADSDSALGQLSGGARRIFQSMLDCEKPIIARVDGAAYGLGASLALCCDIVIASEESRFCDSHVKAGIAAGDGGAALWPLLIGFARAKEYLLTGEVIPAKLAAEIGLISHCVPTTELDAKVNALAQRLADLPPLAVRYTKSSINLTLKKMAMASFELSLAYDLLTLRTEGHAEAVRALTAKAPAK